MPARPGGHVQDMRVLRVVLLLAGVLLAVGGGVWALAGGPGGAVPVALVGVVVVAATAPRWYLGSPGVGRHGAGPFSGGDGGGGGT